MNAWKACLFSDWLVKTRNPLDAVDSMSLGGCSEFDFCPIRVIEPDFFIQSE